MKICIDVRNPGQTGILNYANCLLKSLLKIDQNNEYVIITDPGHRNWGNGPLDEIVVPSSNPIFWMAWSNIALPRILHEKKVDVYHSFKHVTAYRIKAKKVLTFHGGHMHYLLPVLFTWYDNIYWKFSYSMALRKYDRIITVAQGEKNFYVKKLGAPESKFRVIYLAADERFKVIEDRDKLQRIKGKFHLSDHFILYVGQIHPRKNLEGVVAGYYRARPRLKKKYKLVIVGDKSGWYFQKINGLVQQLGIVDDVIFLGRISDHDLPYVYNLADLFLLPSYYEGFGIVLLEAMACSPPVITSNIEDIREVVGKAAILVDPAKVSEIADAIIQVLTSDGLKRSLSEKGLRRARLFSWDRCARETLSVYEELMLQ